MSETTPRILVTNKGPIDRHPPGADVTGLYRAETITRLVKDGYLRRSYKDAVDGDDGPEDTQELPAVEVEVDTEVVADDG